jgi:hypothetical protein
MDELIPIIAVVAVFSVPVIAILTAHQQKMARIFHGNQPAVQPQNDQLAREIAELRHTLAQQAIAIDNLAESQRQLASALSQKENLQERIRA